MLHTSKSLYVVNFRSSWGVIAVADTQGVGRVRDSAGRFTGELAGFEASVIKDRRLARFTTLQGAIDSVAGLVMKAQPDHVVVLRMGASYKGSEVLVATLKSLEFKGTVRVRLSYLQKEYDARTPLIQALKLAKDAWFDSEAVPSSDEWYLRR